MNQGCDSNRKNNEEEPQLAGHIPVSFSPDLIREPLKLKSEPRVNIAIIGHMDLGSTVNIIRAHMHDNGAELIVIDDNPSFMAHKKLEAPAPFVKSNYVLTATDSPKEEIKTRVHNNRKRKKHKKAKNGRR